METPKGGELQGRYAWRFSARCEFKTRPLLDPGWAELLPEWVLQADIFDYAMNREWPLTEDELYLLEVDSGLNFEWPTP
ncbi:hypothetical protein D3C86_2092210 [compost metagenome]